MKQRAFCFALALVWTSHWAAAQEKQPPTPQTQRGRDLFLKSPSGIACGTCHTMAGVGTAVGPDLSTMSKMATPHGLVAVIQMAMTNNVQEVKTAAGTFPGIQKQKQGDDFQIWDLSQTPPVLRTLTSKDILSMSRDSHWKHPPSSVEYTSQQLADIVGFLKWAATGSQKEIKVSDIEAQ